MSRSARASVERVFELARHLTERDREIVLCLYGQQVLTTEQLRLLFFTSRRRAQDRLLFLYRQRVVDRFYPPLPFGSGKPEAHWLLDEAGALIVAAMLGVERRQLGWQRRDDWGSHPQLAHRLEANHFVTDLIAATLPDRHLAVAEWWSPRQAAARIGGERVHGRVRPDAGFLLLTAAARIECYLEWDRGSETQARLADKLIGYRIVEAKGDRDRDEPCSILVVVPGRRRAQTLCRAYSELARAREERRRRRMSVTLDGSWPLLATTASELRTAGPLAPIWRRLDRDDGRPVALADLPASGEAPAAGELERALGRRWRKDAPGFWARLSPLSTRAAAREPDPETSGGDLRPSGIDGSMHDPEDGRDEEGRWR